MRAKARADPSSSSANATNSERPSHVLSGAIEIGCVGRAPTAHERSKLSRKRSVFGLTCERSATGSGTSCAAATAATSTSGSARFFSPQGRPRPIAKPNAPTAAAASASGV